jgi:hypothetical protein
MPASGGRLGPNAPTPAATMTALAMISVPAPVTSRQPPSAVRASRSTCWPR